jgi:hypothetical protein
MPALQTISSRKEREIASYVEVHPDKQRRAAALFSQHFAEKDLLLFHLEQWNRDSGA